MEESEFDSEYIKIAEEHKHLQIRDNSSGSGGYHRRVLTPDMDVSGEVQEIKDKAEELWTDEVKSAWTAFQEAQVVPE